MSEGLADLLDLAGDELLGMFEEDTELAATPHRQAQQAQQAQPATGPPASASTEASWLEDPASMKWEKIRNSFMNAKSAVEVQIEAASMDVREWLDWVIRMAPKQVAVKADVSVLHMLEALGPIDREAYRFVPPTEAQAIDAEYKIVSAGPPSGEAAQSVAHIDHAAQSVLNRRATQSVGRTE